MAPRQKPTTKEFQPVKAAATRTRVYKNVISKAFKRGEIEGRREGRRVEIDMGSLFRWLSGKK